MHGQLLPYNSPITFNQIAAGAKYSSDDVIVGFIIGEVLIMICVTQNIRLLHACAAVLLGYNLTDAPIMMNQYDTYVKSFGLQTLIRYVCETS